MEKPAHDRMSLGDPSLPRVFTRWRHCKGDCYQVVGYSIDPDGAVNVLYIEDPIKSKYQIFNQTAERFLGIHPGLKRPRFEEIR